jgi:hypothetical protein
MSIPLLVLFAFTGWAGGSLVAYKPNPDDPNPRPWPWPWWRDRLFGVIGGLTLGYIMTSTMFVEQIQLGIVSAVVGGIFFSDLGRGLLNQKRN